MDSVKFDDENLAAFQNAFLEILLRLEHSDDLKAALLADPDCQSMKSWIESMSPKMLETAAGLVKKWGSKDEDLAVG